METVTFVSYIPNSGYVDRKGKRHQFKSIGKVGELVTADASLIAELDEAIARGNALYRKGESAQPVAQPKITAAQMAADRLAARQSAVSTVNGILTTAHISGIAEGAGEVEVTE